MCSESDEYTVVLTVDPQMNSKSVFPIGLMIENSFIEQVMPDSCAYQYCLL